LIDIDEDAIEIAKRNVENLDLSDKIQIIKIDFTKFPITFYKKFDVVITNPPFGIRSKKSADVAFLKEALNVN
jgi:predicted RNA methylase